MKKKSRKAVSAAIERIEKEERENAAITFDEEGEVIAIFRRSQSSVILKVDKDGKRSYEVKAYADVIDEATDIALVEAKRLNKNFLK